MFKQIRTSKENKELVSKFTRKFNLGTENIIARVALSYSLAQETKLELENILDSKGKEYSKSVLFGDHYEIYAGMIAVNYNLNISDRNIPKYLKMHIDDGLQLLNCAFEKSKSNNFDFIKDKIQKGLV